MAENDTNLSKTTITIEILSDDPNVEEANLLDLLMRSENGDCVRHVISREKKDLSINEMEEALDEAGSSGDFFQLDEMREEQDGLAPK